MKETTQTPGSAKRVGQFTKNGELIAEYSSASDAARAMNLTKYSIADCCRGRQKTSAGYIYGNTFNAVGENRTIFLYFFGVDFTYKQRYM